MVWLVIHFSFSYRRSSNSLSGGVVVKDVFAEHQLTPSRADSHSHRKIIRSGLKPSAPADTEDEEPVENQNLANEHDDANVDADVVPEDNDGDGNGNGNDIEDFVAAFRPKGLYSLQSGDIEGKRIRISSLGSGPTLVVNVASHCGYTDPNYRGIGELMKTHGHLVNVIGFPCDQFGHQEPGDHEEIRKFVSSSYPEAYGSMALMEKVDVNGANSHPVYTFLKESARRHGVPDAPLEWNFVKFLVGKDGEVIRRYPPAFDLQQIARDVEEAART